MSILLFNLTRAAAFVWSQSSRQGLFPAEHAGMGGVDGYSIRAVSVGKTDADMFSCEGCVDKLAEGAVGERSGREIARLGELRAAAPGGDPVALGSESRCATTGEGGENNNEPNTMYPPLYVAGYDKRRCSIQIKNYVPNRLDESQHDEKYMQGHLIVHHNGEMKETPAEKLQK